MSGLFAAAGVALPVSVADPEERILATPADRMVLDNLPPTVGEEFLFGHVVRPDASGPVDALRGSTLERWGRVKRILALAWRGTPAAERPAILGMKLPELDPARRKRIAALAASLRGKIGR